MVSRRYVTWQEIQFILVADLVLDELYVLSRVFSPSPRKASIYRELTKFYREFLTAISLSSWYFHLPAILLVIRIILIQIDLNSSRPDIWRAVIKPVMQVELDPTSGKQVQLLDRNKFISGQQPRLSKK